MSSWLGVRMSRENRPGRRLEVTEMTPWLPEAVPPLVRLVVVAAPAPDALIGVALPQKAPC